MKHRGNGIEFFVNTRAQTADFYANAKILYRIYFAYIT